LSPRIRTAVDLLRSSEFGAMQSISGTVWQSWGPGTVGTWRQQPELSGGGFLFDTGAHLLNTITDLAGEDFVEIAAWFDMRGRPVETMATVMGRLKSGALVTMHACGEAMPSCSSEIRVFCERAIIYTGMWGEKLEIQTDSKQPLEPYPVPPSLGVWETFRKVRGGELANPCPPEVGLRMAKLWDAIKESAHLRGQPVHV
jgi:predicted dehydrogenase